jgi:hypothetical protein
VHQAQSQSLPDERKKQSNQVRDKEYSSLSLMGVPIQPAILERPIRIDMQCAKARGFPLRQRQSAQKK